MDKLLFLFIIGFVSTLSLHAQNQIGNNIDGEDGGDQAGHSVSMPDATTIAIGSPLHTGTSLPFSFNPSGQVRVFYRNANSWLQKGESIDGEAIGDQSGFSVSMSDANTVAIGAPYNCDSGISAGQVRVYSWNGSIWIQKGSDIDGEAYDMSGYSVSMPNDNTVAIGAINEDGVGTGKVRVYFWNGSDWEKKGTDILGENSQDMFGFSVSMPDSKTIAIGAIWNDGVTGNLDDNRGHVRIYRWNGNNWVQKGLDIDGEATINESGTSVSMPHPDVVAIGAPYNDGADFWRGHVRVYVWNGTSWFQKGMDIDGETNTEMSGTSVSMPDVNTIAIGAPYFGGNVFAKGITRIYSWVSGSWEQRGNDIQGHNENDKSGTSVSMPDANMVAIGAPYNWGNDVIMQIGQVEIYRLKGVTGVIFNDLNENCVRNDEPGLSNRRAIIEPGNIVVETTNRGYWFIDQLPAGTYSIRVDTSGNWEPTCPITQTFTVNNSNGFTSAPSFGFVSTEPCPVPNVSIIMPHMRPGFSNQNIYIQAYNSYTATGALYNAYVDVSIDELLTLDNSALTYSSLGGNVFRFELGTLNPGEIVNFRISTTLSTEAVLGQTLCMEAELFPVEVCMLSKTPMTRPVDFSPCDLPWDGSNISIEGECINDTILFTISNIAETGNGDMDCYSPVRLYIDGAYVLLDSVKLSGGESHTYTFAGEGRTLRMEVDQHPLKPGNSYPSKTIERCGDVNNWVPNLVNIFPHDDQDSVKDIYCGLVKGSYDPNDKTGYPLGIGSEHLIAPNVKMDYLINFQNTGTDTAFTIVVRDTLDTDLDIFSVRSGVSSHNYIFRMYGPRVLEWTFNGILLPDSTTNEKKSHGFVTFSVNQIKNLFDETEINNRVGIYFDYNDPVLTNITSHIIEGPFNESTSSVKNLTDISSFVKLYPNPNTGNFILDIGKNYPDVTIIITDLVGKEIYRKRCESVNKKLEFFINEAEGVYLVTLETEGKHFAQMKMVKQ